MELMDLFLARHWDPEEGGFFLTADNARTGPGGWWKPLEDHAVPSANSVAAMDLFRLAALTGNTEYARKAEEILSLYPPDAGDNPLAYASFLAALDRSDARTFPR